MATPRHSRGPAVVFLAFEVGFGGAGEDDRLDADDDHDRVERQADATAEAQRHVALRWPGLTPHGHPIDVS